MSSLELYVGDRRVRPLSLERLPVPETAAQEFWPGRNRDIRIELLGQQAPEGWMMPAQIVTSAVAMNPDAVPKPSCLGNELVAAHGQKIVVQVCHCVLSPGWRC